MSASGRSRLHRVRRRRGSTESSRVDALWSRLTDPLALGVIVSVAGALVMIAPWLKTPARHLPGRWADPITAPDLLQLAVVLLAGAIVLGLGKALQGAIEEASRLYAASALVAALGAFGALACWLSLQGEVPATQALFGTGREVEFIVGEVRGEPARLMLPRRVEVESLTLGERPEVSVVFSRPKQAQAEAQTLRVGESIEVASMRFTFVGVGVDAEQLRGVVTLSASPERSIFAAARQGATIQLELDGPSYRVEELALNHLGLGPAVKLREEAEGSSSFWVFERAVSERERQVFAHRLTLERLESMPAAVMTVAPAHHPFEPLIASAIALVLGLTGMVALRSDRASATALKAPALAPRPVIALDSEEE